MRRSLLRSSGGGGSYSPEATAVFTRMSGLTTAEKDIMATFIDAQVTNGNWALVDEYYNFYLQDMNNALVGWLNLTATREGSTLPTYSYTTGFTLNGTDNYIDTGFIPSVDAVNSENQYGYMQLNIMNQGTIPASNVYYFGCNGGGYMLQAQIHSSSTDRLRFYSTGNFSASGTTFTATNYALGMEIYPNPTSTRATIFIDNLPDGVNTGYATGGYPTESVFIGCSNVAGTPTGFHQFDAGSWVITGGFGKGFDRFGWYNDEQTMNTALKAL